MTTTNLRQLQPYNDSNCKTLRTEFNGNNTFKIPHYFFDKIPYRFYESGRIWEKPLLEANGDLYSIKKCRLFDKNDSLERQYHSSLLKRGYDGDLQGKALDYFDMETYSLEGLSKVDITGNLKFKPNYALVDDEDVQLFMLDKDIRIDHVIKLNGIFYKVASITKKGNLRYIEFTEMEYFTVTSVHQYVVNGLLHSEYEDYVDFLLAKFYHTKGYI